MQQYRQGNSGSDKTLCQAEAKCTAQKLLSKDKIEVTEINIGKHQKVN
jgi:hypothetical protein